MDAVLCGIVSPSSPIHGFPEAQSATLFANRFSTDVNNVRVQMRLSWSRVAPKSEESVLIGDGNEHPVSRWVRMEVEIAVMCVLVRGQTPRIASHQQALGERPGTVSQSPQKTPTLSTSGSQTSGVLNSEGINFCCFKPPGLQPRKLTQMFSVV